MADTTGQPCHPLLLWETKAALHDQVAAYLGEGLQGGEGVVVLSTPDLLAAVRARLGDALAAAEAQERAVLANSEQVLPSISLEGEPVRERFLAVLQGALAKVAPDQGPVRFYGDMVGLLCDAGRHDLALRVEGWCHTVATAEAGRLQLLCGYGIDDLAQPGLQETFVTLCAAHTSVGVAAAPAPRAADPAPRHIVRFFEDDASLAACAGGYLQEGARLGQPVVAIAEGPTLAALRSYEAAGAEGDAPWILVDASQALEFLLVDGRPDPVRFQYLMASIRRRFPAGSSHFRAYGEMVEVLARRGDWANALALEAIWNAFARQNELSLLCGYSAQHLQGADREAVRHACVEHTTVHAAEVRARGVVDLLGNEAHRLTVA